MRSDLNRVEGEKLYREARELRFDKKYGEALEKIEAALQKVPNNRDFLDEKRTIEDYLGTVAQSPSESLVPSGNRVDVATAETAPANSTTANDRATKYKAETQTALKLLLLEPGWRTQCTNNLRQIVLAFLNYEAARNAFPPLYTIDKKGKPLHSWRVLILPYIEECPLYEKIRLDEPWDSEYNSQFHDKMPLVFACPSNPQAKKGLCNYSVIAGEVFVPAGGKTRSVSLEFISLHDGTSNTVAVVEVREPFCWMNPTADVTLHDFAEGINVGRVGSYHSKVCNVGFCDGSVRFLSEEIDTQTLRALGTCAGGETVERP